MTTKKVLNIIDDDTKSRELLELVTKAANKYGCSKEETAAVRELALMLAISQNEEALKTLADDFYKEVSLNNRR